MVKYFIEVCQGLVKIVIDGRNLIFSIFDHFGKGPLRSMGGGGGLGLISEIC